MSDFNTPNFSVDLSDQVALVTGASSGLGYRFSKVLAKCGAKVALAARRVEKLEALEKEIRDDGGECAVVPLDVQDRDSIRNAVDVVENQMGLINTLINNAGMVDAQWAIKQDDALIDGVVDTNLVGPYLLSNEVARRLIKAEQPGRMVNIASIAGCLMSSEESTLMIVATPIPLSAPSVVPTASSQSPFTTISIP